jgi:hypothetical protein
MDDQNATAKILHYQPLGAELELKRRVEKDFEEMLAVRRRKYRQLGNKTLQQYWDESTKRFLSYQPPKDVTEDEWQANMVMGLTRNAVLNQISKIGTRIPEAHFKTVLKGGISEDMDSLLVQNYYRYSLRRERADRLQPFNALGAFMRGNSCWFEGWEDFEGEAKIITDIDFETGDVKFELQDVKRYGPQRKAVPVNEVFYKNIYVNDLRDNNKVVRRVFMSKDKFKTLFGKNKNYKYVRPGNPSPASGAEDPFFKPSANLGKMLVEVRYEYNSIWYGGPDQYVVWANGVILIDTPMPFNHKHVPLVWCVTEPMDDEFLIGMSTPWKVMNEQDSGDGFFNSMLDRQTLYINRPMITTAEDPDTRTYLQPNGVIPMPNKNSDGTPATVTTYPIEGVSNADMAVFTQLVQMGRENSGAYGGAGAQSPRGGKVSALQARLMEEEAKRLLGIPMASVEFQERDLAALRAMNFLQFTRGHGDKIEIEDALLSDGRRGKVIVHFPGSKDEAERLKPELNTEELAGEKAGEPTEAIIAPTDWYDMVDRVEAKVETESSYMSNRTLDSALFTEKMATMAKIPPLSERVEWDEIARESFKKDGLDPEKFMAKHPVTPQTEEGQPGGPGAMRPQGQQAAPGQPPAPGVGQLTKQALPTPPAPGLGAIMGTQ